MTSKKFEVVAEQTGSLFNLTPTGRFYIAEMVERSPEFTESCKALEFCDAEGRVTFFPSREAAEAAIKAVQS